MARKKKPLALPQHHPRPASGNVLAIDSAAVTGWAIYDLATRETASGCWRHKAKKGDHVGRKFVMFQAALVAMLDTYTPVLVCVERPGGHFKSLAASASCFGYVAFVQAECCRRGIKCMVVSPSEVKQHATGNGNAGKPQMQAAAAREFPGVTDHNQADALWVMSWALWNLGWKR